MSGLVICPLHPTPSSLGKNPHGQVLPFAPCLPHRTSLARLTNAITERLAKAEALTWVLQDSREAQRDGTVSNAAWAIADLIHEARELYAEQWERMRKYAKLEG